MAVEAKEMVGNFVPLSHCALVPTSVLKSRVSLAGRVRAKSVSTDLGSMVAVTFDFETSAGLKSSWMSKLVKRAVYQARPLCSPCQVMLVCGLSEAYGPAGAVVCATAGAARRAAPPIA